MRETKYRAFYKGEMWDVWRIEWLKGRIDNLCLGKDGHNQFWSGLSSDPINVLQYTGLKDKNGVEIYESDVIKSSRTDLNYQVTWNDEAAEWTALCTEPEKDFYMGAYGWVDNEIIGNIYENPALLAGGQDGD